MKEVNEEFSMSDVSNSAVDLNKKILEALLNLPENEELLHKELLETLGKVHSLVVTIDFYNKMQNYKNNNTHLKGVQ